MGLPMQYRRSSLRGGDDCVFLFSWRAAHGYGYDELCFCCDRDFPGGAECVLDCLWTEVRGAGEFTLFFKRRWLKVRIADAR